MASNRKPVQFDEFVANAARIFADIDAHGGSVLVEHDGRLYSVVPKPKKTLKQRPFTEADSLFKLAGIGKSEEPTNIAEHKHDYLAEAYADPHDQ